MIVHYPLELAYALALINCKDRYSITPPWVLHTFPDVDKLMVQLRSTLCITGCPYCNKAFDIHLGLKNILDLIRIVFMITNLYKLKLWKLL